MNEISRALTGEDVQVNVASIERSLSDLWRVEGNDTEQAVTKAALWNMVAHTSNDVARNTASETLARASETVPQRAIIIRAVPTDESHINTWISANCHLLGEGKQVCSEEIVIVAGGDRINHIPPLVNALLMPELPVATWWIGDLPTENEDYLAALLDPVDHLIVDSSAFNDLHDLTFLAKCAGDTNTAPSDLNWARLEQWRVATASLFDVPEVLRLSRHIESVEITYGSSIASPFGQRIESLLYLAWLFGRLGYAVDESGIAEGSAGKVSVKLNPDMDAANGELRAIRLTTTDNMSMDLRLSSEQQAIHSEVKGSSLLTTTVTRHSPLSIDSLLVRQLARQGFDRLYRDVLPLTIRLASDFR